MTGGTSKSLEAAGGPPEPQVAIDDTTLLDACRAGQTRAFGSLVVKYQDRLFNAAVRVCGNRDDAAELCQEAFVKAFEKIGSFRGHSKFYTWLFRIVMNLALSRHRRNARVQFTSLSTGTDSDEGWANAVTSELAARRERSPADRAIGRETQDRVLAALDSLGPDYRVVVVLRDIEDMDYDHMAKTLSLPVGTVKSRLYRGRCMLKEKLADLVRPGVL